MRPWYLQVPLLLVVLILGACSGPRNVIYFDKDIRPDSATTSLQVQPQREAVIQPGDILAINLASITFYKEGNTSQVFLDGGLAYTGAISSSTGSNSTGVNQKNTYLVDSNGYIDYPRLGKIRLGGISTKEAKDLLASRLKDYLYQPAIEVRIVNYRITLLGAISTNGPIYAANHTMTILDAISVAGGIPITGRKDNVLIIRESNGRREFGHIDLNSRNVFNSPFFYLKQNDIVYVEPSRIARQEANEFLRFYLPTISGLFSAAISLYTLILVSSK